LEISKFFKKMWSKTCNFGIVRRENFSLPPPVANISGKNFLGALFNTLKSKVPLEAGAPPPPPPQTFDASYAPGAPVVTQYAYPGQLIAFSQNISRLNESKK
jgi:hypothetical protein